MLYENNGTIFIDERIGGDVFAEEREAARARKAELAIRYDELAEAVRLAEEAAMVELEQLGAIEWECDDTRLPDDELLTAIQAVEDMVAIGWDTTPEWW